VGKGALSGDIYINDRLKKLIMIIGSHDGILEKPQTTYPIGTPSWYCAIKPVNGCQMPSYGSTFL
jgi:hypothetical protein